MGHEDEWIRGEPDDESLDDEWPGDEWPGGEWPDGEWPDGEPPAGPGWPAGAGARTGPGSGYGTGWEHRGVPGFPGRIVVAVAVVAAAAGVIAGFFLVRDTPVASADGRATPTAPASASSGPGAGPQTLPGLPGLPGGASGNGGGQLRMLLTGRVLAVSGTSITIGGTGPSVTAAVTSASKITGHAHRIGGVKVGDEVALRSPAP